MDIDGVCSTEFQSTGTPEPEGIQLEFIDAFLEHMTTNTEILGMDLTEVNFGKTNDP